MYPTNRRTRITNKHGRTMLVIKKPEDVTCNQQAYIYVKMGLVISKHMTTLVTSRCRRKMLENIKRRTSLMISKIRNVKKMAC